MVKEELKTGEEIQIKRGRRPKNQIRKYEINKDQTKFFIDLTSEKEDLNLIFDLLVKANSKKLGREILFKDLALFAVTKLTEKDIEKIQESSLTEMEKVQRALDEHNAKSGTKLSLGEFLIKKLGIN